MYSYRTIQTFLQLLPSVYFLWQIFGYFFVFNISRLFKNNKQGFIFLFVCKYIKLIIWTDKFCYLWLTSHKNVIGKRLHSSQFQITFQF